VACAREHPDPKPSWLAGWDELDEWDKETDRRIGKAVANHAAAVTAVAMHGLHVTVVAEAVSAERERAAAAERAEAAEGTVVHAALDRATERMRAAEGKLAEMTADLRALAEGCADLASNGRDLDRNCTASSAYRDVASDITAIIGTEEESRA